MGLPIEEEGYRPTIGVDAYSLVRGNPPYRLDLWDTAGDSQYLGLGYADAHAAIIVTDCVESASWHQYYNQIRRTLPNIPIIQCVYHIRTAFRGCEVSPLD